MRLRLSIQRNNLPPLKTLFAIDSAADPPTTIACLLEQVNDLVPLEAGNWGLEDYVATIGGYECLHYSKVREIVKEDDELCIRPISTPEQRARTLSGRYQINESGQHLVDGIPFGRPLIRAPNRPAIHIPPRKRRRLSLEDETLQIGDSVEHDGNFHIKLLENGHALDEGDEDSEEDDGEFVPSGEDIDSQDSHEEPEEPEDTHVHSQAAVDATSPAQKRKRSVSFNKVVEVEHDRRSVLTGSSSSQGEESDDTDDDEESIDSDASSSDDDSSEDDSDSSASGSVPLTNGTANNDSSSNTSSDDDDSSDSDSGMQLGSSSHYQTPSKSVTNGLQQPSPDKPLVPPGEGKRETQKRNVRRRQKRQLTLLIQTGCLPVGATIRDLQDYLESTGAPTRKMTRTGARKATESTEELENQRRRLLALLQNGGIDVETDVTKPFDAPNSNSQDDPLSSVAPAITASSCVDVETGSAKQQPLTDDVNGVVDSPVAEGQSKRPRINLAGSNRLIFGSLGVRTPSSKDEGERVRAKLASRGDLVRTQAAATTKPSGEFAGETNAVQDTDSDILLDAWRSKITLKAVECADEGVTLSEPPYPFVQCWDEQYYWNRPQSHSKKRKRKNRNQKQYSGNEADEEEVEQWTEDMYDDEAAVNSELKTHVYFNKEGEEELDEDAAFPAMPTDVDALPSFKASSCSPGAYIVFKVLHVDSSTKWQPEISDWQVARVDKNMIEDGLWVTLAPEHRRETDATFDEEGRRIRDGSQMPGSDEEEEDEQGGVVDNGEREISLESILQLKLLQAAAESANFGTYTDNEFDNTRAKTYVPGPVAKGLDGTATNGDVGVDSDIEWDGLGDEPEVHEDEIPSDLIATTNSIMGALKHPMMEEDASIDLLFSTSPAVQAPEMEVVETS